MERESRKSVAGAARKLGRGAALALAMASTGLGVSLYMAPAPAYAIYCSNCSTFYQQMFEYAEAVIHLVELVLWLEVAQLGIS